MRMREPYVGEGVDGALRSAQIDREEADCYDRGDPLRDHCLASAERWEEQAEELRRREEATWATTDDLPPGAPTVAHAGLGAQRITWKWLREQLGPEQ